MRAVLINIGIILAIALAYYIDFFGWFTTKYAFWGSLVLVIAVLLAAFKVLGNPWHKALFLPCIPVRHVLLMPKKTFSGEEHLRPKTKLSLIRK